jgi:glycosyltransferase involved in cell wall biosynthesis
MKKFNIGLFHYLANFTDGVSLEMNKWKQVFEQMGHTVQIFAGKFGSNEEILIEEMYHHRSDSLLLHANTFKALKDYNNEAIYRADLNRLSGIIEKKLQSVIEKERINFLVPQNVWSVAANPAVAIALTNIMRKYKIPALAHNHDFYFERINGYVLTCNTAAELVDLYFPPRDPLAKHVVINSLAQHNLMQRKGINSSIIPNTFNFEDGIWEPDDYNQDLRHRIGLQEDDIFILQATRIVTRKGIELAIDFVEALNSPKRRNILKSHGLYNGRTFSDNSRIVLVIAGHAMDDVPGEYKNLLVRKAKEIGVETIYIEDLISERRETVNGVKKYSLWDSYVYADLVTYPSQWEGWGNQLLEAIRARLPVMLFEYPVYEADIKEKGLQVISLGNQIKGHDDNGLFIIDPKIIDIAADQAIEFLINYDLRQRTVDHNFRVGKKHYSIDTLYIYLEQLMRGFESLG